MLPIAAALLAGLAGSAHCFGMCGGMAGALGMRARMQASSAVRGVASTSLYHVGRIGGYAVIGAIGGTFGHTVHSALDFTRYAVALRIVAGVLMLLIALRILSHLNPFAPIERAGARIWRKLQPLANNASSSQSWPSNLIVGLLWGWLPCGLVYSAAMLTLTTGSAIEGAALMLAFGLGTMPAMLSSSLLAGTLPRLSQRPWFRRATGVAMAMFGCWMIVGPQLMHIAALHAH